MANQAYNGQPVNISFDYEGEGTLDSKLVQLSESAAKDPTTWLKNGIYRIGNGQPVFTQDGKLLLYIGRNGNATDIADDTKWVKFTSTADVQAAISNATGSGFSYQGNTATVPANPVNKGMYRASAAFTIPVASCLSGSAEKVQIGDMLIAIETEGANDTTVIKYSVVQNNIDTDGLVRSAAATGASGHIPVFTGQDEIEDSQIAATDLGSLIGDFKGTSSATMPNSPVAGSLADLKKQFNNNGNALSANTGLVKGELGDGEIPEGAYEPTNPREGVILAGYTDSNNKTVVCQSTADVNAIEMLAARVQTTQGQPTSLADDSLNFEERYIISQRQEGFTFNALFAKFCGDSQYSKCNNYMQSQAQQPQELVNIPEKCSIAEMTNEDGYSCADENTFCSEVQFAGIPSLLSWSGNSRSETFNGGGANSAPVRIVLAISTTNGASSNFFGFTKSAPKVAALLTRGDGNNLNPYITFKNYDFAGTLSTPCIEYTYDLVTHILSYTQAVEVTVSNS